MVTSTNLVDIYLINIACVRGSKRGEIVLSASAPSRCGIFPQETRENDLAPLEVPFCHCSFAPDERVKALSEPEKRDKPSPSDKLSSKLMRTWIPANCKSVITLFVIAIHMYRCTISPLPLECSFSLQALSFPPLSAASEADNQLFKSSLEDHAPPSAACSAGRSSNG